jgi:hypothetical protein
MGIAASFESFGELPLEIAPKSLYLGRESQRWECAIRQRWFYQYPFHLGFESLLHLQK